MTEKQIQNLNLLVVAAAVVGVVLNMLARNILAEIVVAEDVRIELVLEYDWKKEYKGKDYFKFLRI